MPILRAFRALRYDPLAVPDAGVVLCPPYDVINPTERRRLAARDARNAVHVELPVAPGGQGGAADDAAYSSAAELFAAWQRDGTLRRDARPVIYPYEQRYRPAGETEHVARGFFCRLRLEDPAPGGHVRRHERTMGPPKEDRYRLLRAVGANLSPVLLLHDETAKDPADDQRTTAGLLDDLMHDPPELEATDDAGTCHRLWSADPSVSGPAAALLELTSAGPLTIADGHHRYETALRYRDEQRAQADGWSADAGSEYLLALLYDARSGGLIVLPTHRLVRGVGSGKALLAAAGGLFGVEWHGQPEAILAALGGDGEARTGRLGVWTRDGGAVLTVERERLAPLLPEGASDALRWLDVTVLDSALERLTGRPAGDLVADGRMLYSKDAPEAIGLVESGQADAAFLLAPTPIGAVLAIAAAGEVMPQKSTYFQPKAATGLVFNTLAE